MHAEDLFRAVNRRSVMRGAVLQEKSGIGNMSQLVVELMEIVIYKENNDTL